MKKYLTIIACCLLSVAAHALTFSGKVTNEAGEVMPYVSVYIQDMKTGDMSDLDGNYIVTDIEAGRHTIVVSHMGYGTQTLEIDFQRDETRDFILSEQAYTMNEIFVTPNGECIQLFILRQLVEKYQKLGKRVDHFTKTSVGEFEQRNNVVLSIVPSAAYGALKTMFALIAAKNYITSIFENPNLKVSTKAVCQFKGGSVTNWDCSITSYKPQLSDKDLRAWRRMVEYSQDNGYDDSYKQMSKLLKEVDKLFKKDPDGAAKKFTYGGAYEEGEHVVHIIKYGKNEYHIVDGCWQLRRMNVSNSSKNNSVEFCEIAKDLYMPISASKKFTLFSHEEIEESRATLRKLETTGYENLSKDDQKKYKDLSAMLKGIPENGEITITMASSINYTDFVLKGASLLDVGSSSSRMVK